MAEGILMPLMKLRADPGLTDMFIIHGFATVKATDGDVGAMQ